MKVIRGYPVTLTFILKKTLLLYNLQKEDEIDTFYKNEDRQKVKFKIFVCYYVFTISLVPATV